MATVLPLHDVLDNGVVGIHPQDLKKYLSSFKPAKIKKPESLKNACFVNFRSEEDRQVSGELLVNLYKHFLVDTSKSHD